MGRKYTQKAVIERVWESFVGTELHARAVAAFSEHNEDGEAEVRTVFDSDLKFCEDAYKAEGRHNDRMALRRATLKIECGVDDSVLLEELYRVAVRASSLGKDIEKAQKMAGSCKWHYNRAIKAGDEQAASRWTAALTRIEELIEFMWENSNADAEKATEVYKAGYEAERVRDRAKAV